MKAHAYTTALAHAATSTTSHGNGNSLRRDGNHPQPRWEWLRPRGEAPRGTAGMPPVITKTTLTHRGNGSAHNENNLRAP